MESISDRSTSSSSGQYAVNRRTILTSVGTLGTGLLGGCSELVGSTPLSHGDVSRRQDEAFLTFENDAGTDIARFGVEYDRLTAARWNVELHATHSESTRLSAIRYNIHAPAADQRPFVRVYLKEPGGGPWPEIEFEGGPTETVIAIDNFGERGEGSLGLDLLMEANDRVDHLPVRVIADYTLANVRTLAGKFEATGSIRIDLPGTRN